MKLESFNDVTGVTLNDLAATFSFSHKVSEDERFSINRMIPFHSRKIGNYMKIGYILGKNKLCFQTSLHLRSILPLAISQFFSRNCVMINLRESKVFLLYLLYIVFSGQMTLIKQKSFLKNNTICISTDDNMNIQPIL